MDTEKEYRYEVEIETSLLNENNILKPYAYQSLFAQIVEQHLPKINVDTETTMKYNLAWVLISLSIEILKPVEGCIKMHASTWFSQKRDPFYRRELVFRDENSEIIFQGSTFSVLFDIDKRTIYRSKGTPFPINDPTEEFTLEASPSFKTKLEYEKVDERKVYNSYIDGLGHVNNCRYSEFAYDIFTDEERDNLYKLKRIEIYFLSELRNKDIFQILKSYNENKLFVKGYNTNKDHDAFDAIFEFAR